MKYLLLIGFLLFTGCDKKIQTFDTPKEIIPYTVSYEKVCIEGVVYINAYRRLTVYIDNVTLKPIKCEIKKEIK